MACFVRCSRFVLTNGFKNLYRTKEINNLTTQTLRHFHRATVLLNERKYTEKHEWVTVENNIGTVGISQYAQEALGDIVYAQLPEVDDEFEPDDECGAVESVKAASEIYCPVSGKVTEKNTAVEEKPELINQSCYEKGWLFKIELTNADELKNMMDEDGYNAFLQSQNDD